MYDKLALIILAGVLNPLDCPHHVRADQDSLYREGVVVDKPAPVKGQKGSYVNVGLKNDVQIDKRIQPGVRVTVKMASSTSQTAAEGYFIFK